MNHLTFTILKNGLIRKITWFIFLFCIYLFYLFTFNEVLLVFSTIFSSACMLYRYRKNTFLLVVFFLFLYANYSIGLFYWFDIFHVQSTQSILWFTHNKEIMDIALQLLFLFESVIVIASPTEFSTYNIYDQKIVKERNNNNFISTIMLIVALFISAYDILTTILNRRYIQTSVFEYLSIIFIIGLYYSGKSRILRNSLIFVLSIDCLYVFANGDRGAAIQFILIVYFMFLSKIIKGIKLGVVIVFAGVFLTVIGNWRNTTTINSDLIQSSIESFFKTGIMSDTAYYAAGAGLSFILMTQKFTMFNRLSMFAEFLLSMIVGSSFLKGYVPLATLSYSMYPHHSFGGFLPYYAYFYLGVSGVILIAILVAYYINIVAKTNEDSSEFKMLLCVYFATTTYRWYLYSPSQLIRGPLILFILYKVFDFICKRKKSQTT